MKMKGHKVRCRCVGCSPSTRRKGMRAMKAAPKRRNPRKKKGREEVYGDRGTSVYSQCPARPPSAGAHLVDLFARGMPCTECGENFAQPRGQKTNPTRRRPPRSMVAGGPDRRSQLELGTGEVVCSACGDHPVFRWADPCMDAVKARHRAAVTHKCSCGRKARPREVGTVPGGRRWIACDRCLGTIKQLNPGARDLPQPVGRDEVPVRCRHCDRLLGVGSAGTPPVECTKCSETVAKARKTYRKNPGHSMGRRMPICPECSGNLQTPGDEECFECGLPFFQKHGDRRIPVCPECGENVERPGQRSCDGCGLKFWGR